MPPSQLDQIIFALQPHDGLIPPATAKPGDRAAALLAWADSELGCGVAQVEQVLEAALASQPPSESAWMEPAAAARRDVQVGQDVTNSNVVSGDDNRIEIHHHYGLPKIKPDATRQDANEKTLIEAVWTEVEDRLRQSLHNAILIRLEMAEQRNQVTRPWDSQLRTAEQGTKDLAPGTHIADVFDRRDVGGKLLILGNPGSGKTTTMLDLAAVLIQRANGQSEQPIPVMVNLSSLQKANQSITDWLVNELRLKYGVSHKLAQTWLVEKKLLPLLDGLDELPSERQEPVVQAINEWLQSGEGPRRLLVCSRLEEYELYAEKLALNGAVCLEPLTNEQLQAYLGSLGMESLWGTLQQDKDLLTLVRTPLLLSVSILAREGIDPLQWLQKQTTQARMDYLLDAYVERRLHEVVKSQKYQPRQQPTAKQTRHWLVWLARQLREQSEDEFLIEKMQPSMIEGDQQNSLYELTSILILGFASMVIFGFFGATALAFGLGGKSSVSNTIFALIVIGFSIFWLSSMLGSLAVLGNPITTVEELEISFLNFDPKTFLAKLIKWIFIGVLLELSCGVILIIYSSPSIFVLAPLIMCGFIGVITGLSDAFRKSITGSMKPNQGIRSSFKNTISLSFVSFFVSLLAVSFSSESLLFLMAVLWLSILFAGVMSSGFPCVQHFSLRLVLHWTNAIPWNYARFLNHCTDLLLLQRVGGRYRFIHKLVQEHFAAME